MDFSNIFKCKLPVINPKERGIGVGVHLQLVGFINGWPLSTLELKIKGHISSTNSKQWYSGLLF